MNRRLWSEMRAYIALYSVLSTVSSQFAIRGDACAQTVCHDMWSETLCHNKAIKRRL
jgi:hypothetical protein